MGFNSYWLSLFRRRHFMNGGSFFAVVNGKPTSVSQKDIEKQAIIEKKQVVDTVYETDSDASIMNPANIANIGGMTCDAVGNRIKAGAGMIEKALWVQNPNQVCIGGNAKGVLGLEINMGLPSCRDRVVYEIDAHSIAYNNSRSDWGAGLELEVSYDGGKKWESIFNQGENAFFHYDPSDNNDYTAYTLNFHHLWQPDFDRIFDKKGNIKMVPAVYKTDGDGKLVLDKDGRKIVVKEAYPVVTDLRFRLMGRCNVRQGCFNSHWNENYTAKDSNGLYIKELVL